MTTEITTCPHCQKDINNPPPPDAGSVGYWLVECEKWTWNYNETEIAKQLISDRVTSESEEFENFKEAFTQFFTGDQKDNDRTLEVIKHILETFGDG